MSSTPRAFHNKLAAVRVIRQSIIPRDMPFIPRDMPWSDHLQTTKAPVAAAPGKWPEDGRHSPLIAVREGLPDRLEAMRVSRCHAPLSARA